MAALRICMFVCVSREQFLNKKAFIKMVWIKSSNLQSIPSKFRILWAKLFFSITAEAKNFFLKSYVLFWKRICFQYIWWCIKSALKRLVWKDIEEIHFCTICKGRIIFYTSGEVEATLELVHRKVFLLRCLLLLL